MFKNIQGSILLQPGAMTYAVSTLQLRPVEQQKPRYADEASLIRSNEFMRRTKTAELLRL